MRTSVTYAGSSGKLVETEHGGRTAPDRAGRRVTPHGGVEPKPSSGRRRPPLQKACQDLHDCRQSGIEPDSGEAVPVGPNMCTVAVSFLPSDNRGAIGEPAARQV